MYAERTKSIAVGTRLLRFFAALSFMLLALGSTSPHGLATTRHLSVGQHSRVTAAVVAAGGIVQGMPTLPGRCPACSRHLINCAADGCAAGAFVVNMTGGVLLATPQGCGLRYGVSREVMPVSLTRRPDPPPPRPEI